MIKEEAIEILSDMRAEYNIFSDDEEEVTRYHALSWAIQALNEQQRTERWIPVSERPPETDKEVFVYLWGDVPYLARVNDEGQWETDHFYLDADEAPKAWMQLPEPYKEVE